MDNKDDRAARLAAELRANLRKRKQRARGAEMPADERDAGTDLAPTGR